MKNLMMEITTKAQLYSSARTKADKVFMLPGEVFIVFQNEGRSQSRRFGIIVVVGNEPLERTEVSQNSEGLNVKWLPI